MLIAVPSEAPGGLDAQVSEHFGHCAAFTLVNVDDGAIGEVSNLANNAHEQGGCLGPVMLLKDNKVDALLAGGMGQRPLAGFHDVGIKVFQSNSGVAVRDAVQRYIDGDCAEFDSKDVCAGNGHCGDHGHAHAPVERKPIEGKADVQTDRVVTIEYKLTDTAGAFIDSSEKDGPMAYLHGHGTLVPKLEEALNGLEPGERKVVDIVAADAYGERDEGRVFEAPRDQLPPQAAVGHLLRAAGQDGNPMTVTVVGLDDKVARLDANHPLAGRDLRFDITIVKVEQPTEEEIAHSHAH